MSYSMDWKATTQPE